MFKTTLKFLFLILLILVAGGLGGVVFDRYFVPKFASAPWFSKIPFFRDATEHVTIINTTEQVTVREDDTVEQIVSQPASAVVNIIVLGTAVVGTKAGVPAPVPYAPGVETTTGVLLTNDGLVVTYSDQALGAPGLRYRILLYDGSSHDAAYVGRDPFTNLAFFRLGGNVNTPAIALANSDDVRVGKKVVAIGNASAEYQNRLSLGILENNNRVYNLSGKTVASTEKLEGVFEAGVGHPDQYVGGPVIGYNGEMIGLLGSQALDNAPHPFLIPSNVVRASMERAIAGTLDTRPALGAYYLTITKAYALSQGLSRDRGALIYSPSGRTGLAVIADSPAARAGLQFGDIVTAVNGQEVNLDHPFSDILAAFHRGDGIELSLLRDGNELTVPVQL